MSLIIFILILIALILVHELGHFAAAKLAKVRVEEFGIFFPPRLFGKKIGETTYTFNLIPLGGFVRIYGESGGESDSRSFSAQKRPVQAAIIVAGIVMNLLFAWMVFTAGYLVGLPAAADASNRGQLTGVQTIIVGVLPNSPAQKEGMQSGDIIQGAYTATEEFSGTTSDELRTFIAAHAQEEIYIDAMRDGEEKQFTVRTQEGLVLGESIIGIRFADVGTLRLPLFSAVQASADLGWRMTRDTAAGLGGFIGSIFAGKGDFSSVAGPIGIAQIGATAVASGWSAAVMITALISINLALLNILPIPGLDGGRLFLIGLEVLRRKPFSQAATVRYTMVGFAALLLLMLAVTYHDIARIF